MVLLSENFDTHAQTSCRLIVNCCKSAVEIVDINWRYLDFFQTRKLSARFARASTFLAPAESYQRISDDPP